jgi:hypothetical protein
MFHKPIRLMFSICLSIVLLTACAWPADISLQSLREAGDAVGFAQVNNPTAQSRAISVEYDQLPLYFVENRGQMDPNVAYTVLGGDIQVYFADDGVTFTLKEPNRTDASLQRWTVKLDFIDANTIQPIGSGETAAVISYFKSAPGQWHTGLPTYAQVAYRDLWPGIDLVYYGQAGQLRYDFLVHPGADPAQIRLRYRGAGEVNLNPLGQLVVNTPLGGFVDEAPAAWQETNGGRAAVAAAYAFSTDVPAAWDHGGTVEGVTFGFSVGPYDRSQMLVIDPVVLVYCGFIGGIGDDGGWAIAVDGDGSIYVAGETASTETSFPVTVGPDLTYNGFDRDAFVVKVNPTGTALIYAGYIGGTGNDYGMGIVVDNDHNAYITGFTGSTEASFPVTIGPDLTANGVEDGFVAKVNAAGTGLVYAGFIGGGLWDKAYSIAVDSDGAAYVTGSVGSDQGSFPVKGGPDLTFNGVDDAYVAKVSPAGDTLLYCGYIGGANWDLGRGIEVDNTGAAYIVGETNSTEANFPVLVGPDLTYNGGDRDAFVAKVNPAGTRLIYTGYIGGSSGDYGRALALDGTGAVYIAGQTISTQASFPVLVGPDLTYNGGAYDAFAVKVNPAGTALVYAGYIGGDQDDNGRGIAVDSSGAAYIIGETGSGQNSFPVIQGPDLTYNGGGNDAYIAKVSDSGAALVYSGYIGGAGSDYGTGITVDGADDAHVAGITSSNQDSFPLRGGPDQTFNGGTWDAYVAKVSIFPFAYYLPLVGNLFSPAAP